VQKVKAFEKEGKFMAFVAFDSVESSFRAMVLRQGKMLLGKRAHLSFTRSKI
jgi:hypothetical protein